MRMSLSRELMRRHQANQGTLRKQTIRCPCEKKKKKKKKKKTSRAMFIALGEVELFKTTGRSQKLPLQNSQAGVHSVALQHVHLA